MGKQFLSTKEVAERYGLSAGTLEVWRSSTKRGKPKGPKWTELDDVIRYSLSDLEEWEKSRNLTTASE